MELVSWQFWLQIAAIVFVAGGGWFQLKALKEAVSALSAVVSKDHDMILHVAGQLEGMSAAKEQAHNDLARRVGVIERRLFNGSDKR